MPILTDDIHDSFNGFRRVRIGDEVDAMWGYSEHTISRCDIDHLLNGGVLYYSDGEYAMCFALKRDTI